MSLYSRMNFKVRSLIFFGFHLTPLLAIWSGFSFGAALFGAVFYCCLVFGITAGFHRYLSHRSFKTSRVFQFVLALMGTLALQKGNLHWTANHRDHHRFSDKPDDIHSPVQEGFWWSHIGWIIAEKAETRWHRIKDLLKFPELRWLNYYWIVPYIALCVAVFFTLGFPYLVWGCFIPIVLCWHATFCVNSICHIFGSKIYKTSDESRNNLIVALMTGGEGWHNCHHHYPASAKQGFRWYQIDMTFYALWLLEQLGVVWDLNRAPPEVVFDSKKLL